MYYKIRFIGSVFLFCFVILIDLGTIPTSALFPISLAIVEGLDSKRRVDVVGSRKERNRREILSVNSFSSHLLTFGVINLVLTYRVPMYNVGSSTSVSSHNVSSHRIWT